MRTRLRRRTTLLSLVVATALSMLLAACGGGGGGSSDSKNVTFWTSLDQVTVDAMTKYLVPKAKAEGITLKVQRVDNINQVLMAKIQANDAPDISTVPQPGVLQDVVKRHAAFPLDNVVDMNDLKTNMVPGTLDVGTVDGKLYGVMIGMGVKSMVLYPKAPFEKAGYKAPQSLPELEQLTQQIRSDGGVPWCFGIGSEAATGWPATDWMEDLIMRYGGPDKYKAWVEHKIPFDDPVVKQSGQEMEKLLFTPSNTVGGIKAAASTDFTAAVQPMFKDPNKPGCWLLHMATFITANMPKNVQANPAKYLGVFPMPPATAGGENPVLIGGDTAMMLNDNDSTKKVMKLLANKDLLNTAVKPGAVLSPFKNFDPANYPNDLIRSVAKIGTNASVALFDGSDSMPAQVGTGSFWKEMTKWISGQENLDAALKNIDSSWPSS